jgi:hypothetical protein
LRKQNETISRDNEKLKYKLKTKSEDVLHTVSTTDDSMKDEFERLESEVASLQQSLTDASREKTNVSNSLKNLEKDHQDLRENYIILHQNYSDLSDRYKRLENINKQTNRKSISSQNGLNLDYLITDGDAGTNEEVIPIQENNVVDMKIKLNGLKSHSFPRFPPAERILKKKSDKIEVDGVLVQGKQQMETLNSNYSYTSIGDDRYAYHKQDTYNDKYSDDGSYSSRNNRDPNSDNSVHYDSKQMNDYVDPKKKEYSLDNSYNSADEERDNYISIPKCDEYGSDYTSGQFAGGNKKVSFDLPDNQYEQNKYSDPK